MKPTAPRPRSPWLTRNVVGLGLASLFNDVSSEMVVPLLPFFLTSVLGVGPLALGWIEGGADAVASLLKLLSGRVADRLGRHRPLVLAGYAVSVLARPFVATTTTAAQVLGVRLVDRAGKGVRTSPRDALLARSVKPARRGSAFGFHRAMDHAGAVIGPLIAFSLLSAGGMAVRSIFWWCALPGLLAVVCLAVFVRDRPARLDDTDDTRPTSDGLPRADSERALTPAGETAPAAPAVPSTWRPPVGLGILLVPLGLFSLGNASDLFLLLKASESRSPLMTLPLLWMAFHVVKSVSSVIGGRLADRFGRRRLIVSGWLVYAAVYAGFALTTQIAMVCALFIVYGLYHGLTEGAEKALIADLAPATRHGAAFGWYHVTLGAGALAASVLFGGLWQGFGSATAFAASSGLALAAAAWLGFSPRHTIRSGPMDSPGLG